MTFAAVLMLALHALAQTGTEMTKSGASAQLAALLAAADDADLEFDPFAALQRGDARHAGQFGDYISDVHLARVRSVLTAQLERLGGITRDQLGGADRIAYDVFEYQTRFALRAHDVGVAQVQQKMPLDHVFGRHIGFAQDSSGEGIAPFRTVADYEHGLQRFDGFVVFLDRAIENMRRGMRSGHVHHRVITQKMIAQFDEALAGGVDASPFVQPVLNFPSAIGAADRERLAAAYRDAVGNRILPAYRRVRDFLRGEYLGAGRSGAPGLASLPDGATLYAHALEQFTTVRMAPDEIHRLGRAEVARIRAEMQGVLDELRFKGTLAEFFRHVQSEPTLQFKSRDELLAGYGRIAQRVQNQLGTLFAKLPAGRFEIRPVPAEQEGSAGGAYYVIGTPDGSRPGVFYVNTSELPTRTAPRMTALFLHEALPGHHLQGALSQEDVSLPALLRFGFNAGYGEGWALYAEWLGTEMGLYADPYQRFGRLDMEIIRAARLVVDTGLHLLGWSRERAIDYLLENSSLDASAAAQEIDRYIVWPGQATAYKVDEIFIRRLRERATAQLGTGFDVREFHREVLDTGAIPLAVLERKIDAWVERRLAVPR